MLMLMLPSADNGFISRAGLIACKCRLAVSFLLLAVPFAAYPFFPSIYGNFSFCGIFSLFSAYA